MSVRRNPDSNRDNKLWEIAVIIAIPIILFLIATVNVLLAILLAVAGIAYVFYKCGWNWDIVQEKFWEFWYGIR